MSKTEQKQEIEANQFAMELLMPEKLFTEEIAKLRKQLKYRYNDDALIHRLAIRCQISEDAVRTRMINLGILTSI